MNCREMMENILIQHLELCGNGWRKKSIPPKEFKEDRDWMLSDEAIDQLIHACHWVALMKPIESINREVTSYHLKHMAEHYFKTYITNGVFIAAALHYGYQYKRHKWQVMFMLVHR